MSVLDHFDTITRRKWQQLKDKSQAKGLPFDLSVDDIKRLYLKRRCQYTGVEFPKLKTTYGKRDMLRCRSIERVIPDLGYVRRNVLVTIRSINTLKDNIPVEQVISMGETLKKLSRVGYDTRLLR